MFLFVLKLNSLHVKVYTSKVYKVCENLQQTVGVKQGRKST